MDRIDKLIGRLNKNLSDYHSSLIKGFGKQEIIDMDGHIVAMSDAHIYLTKHHTFDYEQAEYLLQFQNPLAIVADKWESRISDLSDMSFDLDAVFDKRDALQSDYPLVDGALAQEEASAAAETPAVIPSISDRLLTDDVFAKKMRHSEFIEERTREADSIAQARPSLLDRRLMEHEFYKGINKLLPDLSPDAIANWVSYTNQKEHSGERLAVQTLSELTEQFSLAKQSYGAEIAAQVFHVALEMPIPASHIPGAAAHLKNGGDINEIIDLSLEGKLLSMPDALQHLRERTAKSKPSEEKQTHAAEKPLPLSEQIAEGRKRAAEQGRGNAVPKRGKER